MSLTIEKSDTAIREAFYNMEEGVEYVLNDFWFQETNRLRKEYGYSFLKDKHEYKFSRRGEKLFVNSGFVFDFDGKKNLALSFSLAGLAFTLTLTLTLALQHNGIEKLNNGSCAGKVAEIDGKKHKLTAV